MLSDSAFGQSPISWQITHDRYQEFAVGARSYVCRAFGAASLTTVNPSPARMREGSIGP